MIHLADHSLRELNQIHADCARNLKPIETGDTFTAILAALLDEDWTTPKIEGDQPWIGSSEGRPRS
ncbi:MAG: hypothetical protein WBC80_20165 [Isosphaeraceae bacterium]